MPKKSRKVEAIFHTLFAPHAPHFHVQLWDGTILDFGNGSSGFKLIFNNPKVFRRLVLNPNSFSIGQAFVTKEFEIHGDLFEAVKLMDFYENLRLTAWDKLKILMILSRI